MSIDIVTKNGKKLGKITDSNDEEDVIIVKGKKVKLSDAYSNQEIRDSFNSQIKVKDENK